MPSWSRCPAGALAARCCTAAPATAAGPGLPGLPQRRNVVPVVPACRRTNKLSWPGGWAAVLLAAPAVPWQRCRAAAPARPPRAQGLDVASKRPSAGALWWEGHQHAANPFNRARLLAGLPPGSRLQAVPRGARCCTAAPATAAGSGLPGLPQRFIVVPVVSSCRRAIKLSWPGGWAAVLDAAAGGALAALQGGGACTAAPGTGAGCSFQTPFCRCTVVGGAPTCSQSI